MARRPGAAAPRPMNASPARRPIDLAARLRRVVPRTVGGWARVAAWLLGWAAVLTAIGIVVAPMLQDRTSLGTHDWDQMESHRYLVVKSIRRFGQFPFWNPYACGGSPSWAGIESGTNVVSPWFPFYLFE